MCYTGHKLEDYLHDSDFFSFFFFTREIIRIKSGTKHVRSNDATCLTKYYLHFMNKNLYSIYMHTKAERTFSLGIGNKGDCTHFIL